MVRAVSLGMPREKPDAKVWKRIAEAMRGVDDGELRRLVRPLYDLSPENRAFLATWCGEDESGDELREKYKAKITAQFFANGRARLNGGLDLAACRKVLNEYRRVTKTPEVPGRDGGGDVRGYMDLGLHYIEVGTRYSVEVCWDEVRGYTSMGSVLDEIGKVVGEVGEGPELAAEFLPRIRAVAAMGSGIGYGFGDDLAWLAHLFERVAGGNGGEVKGGGGT